MNTPIHAITEQDPPQFDPVTGYCWLLHKPSNSWCHHVDASDSSFWKRQDEYTHWHPDQPTAPITKPDAPAATVGETPIVDAVEDTMRGQTFTANAAAAYLVARQLERSLAASEARCAEQETVCAKMREALLQLTPQTTAREEAIVRAALALTPATVNAAPLSLIRPDAPAAPMYPIYYKYPGDGYNWWTVVVQTDGKSFMGTHRVYPNGCAVDPIHIYVAEVQPDWQRITLAEAVALGQP